MDRIKISRLFTVIQLTIHHFTNFHAHTAKTAILNIRIFILNLDVLAFTVVRTAYAYFKVIVHSNLVGGHYKLGELGSHCGKTTISTFKMLMHIL